MNNYEELLKKYTKNKFLIHFINKKWWNKIGKDCYELWRNISKKISPENVLKIERYFKYFDQKIYKKNNKIPESILLKNSTLKVLEKSEGELLFDKVKRKPIYFDVSKNDKINREKTLEKLIQSGQISLQFCVNNYSLSQNFYKIFNKSEEIINLDKYYEKSCKNFSDEFILKNIEKINTTILITKRKLSRKVIDKIVSTQLELDKCSIFDAEKMIEYQNLSEENMSEILNIIERNMIKESKNSDFFSDITLKNMEHLARIIKKIIRYQSLNIQQIKKLNTFYDCSYLINYIKKHQKIKVDFLDKNNFEKYNFEDIFHRFYFLKHINKFDKKSNEIQSKILKKISENANYLKEKYPDFLIEIKNRTNIDETTKIQNIVNKIYSYFK